MTDQLRGAMIFCNVAASLLFACRNRRHGARRDGTYGLVSYTVKQSTHEIRIHMALCASGMSVTGQFVGRGLRMGVIGALIGIVAALGVTRLLGNVLFGVSALDATSFSHGLVIIVGGVLLASAVPAWRARHAPTRCAHCATK